MTPIEKTLYNVFKAQGAADPTGPAKRAAEAYQLDQRNLSIYNLRAALSDASLAQRFNLSTVQIRRIVRVCLKSIRANKGQANDQGII